VALIGGPPQSAKECFDMIVQNRFTGLLRLDILTVFVMPLYYVLFFALYVLLKHRNPPLISLLTAAVFAGVTIFLSAPSVFSFTQLADQYVSAATPEAKNSVLSAGQALLATDIWHGTGPMVGGILVQAAATIFSIAMRKEERLGKTLSITGVLTHGLDLAHIPMALIWPDLANGMMAVAGCLYLVWFPLLAAKLFRLSATGNNL
jgi:hypothetical protein